MYNTYFFMNPSGEMVYLKFCVSSKENKACLHVQSHRLRNTKQIFPDQQLLLFHLLVSGWPACLKVLLKPEILSK